MTNDEIKATIAEELGWERPPDKIDHIIKHLLK